MCGDRKTAEPSSVWASVCVWAFSGLPACICEHLAARRLTRIFDPFSDSKEKRNKFFYLSKVKVFFCFRPDQLDKCVNSRSHRCRRCGDVSRIHRTYFYWWLSGRCSTHSHTVCAAHSFTSVGPIAFAAFFTRFNFFLFVSAERIDSVHAYGAAVRQYRGHVCWAHHELEFGEREWMMLANIAFALPMAPVKIHAIFDLIAFPYGRHAASRLAGWKIIPAILNRNYSAFQHYLVPWMHSERKSAFDRNRTVNDPPLRPRGQPKYFVQGPTH